MQFSSARRRVGAGILTLLANAVSLLAQTAAPDASYDVVIRNGRVLDGMGNPWILADVAIKDGRFVEIGKVDGTRHAGDRRAAAGTCRPAGST